MHHDFVHANRLELTARCRAKIAARASPAPGSTELEYVIVLARSAEPRQCSEYVTSFTPNG